MIDKTEIKPVWVIEEDFTSRTGMTLDAVAKKHNLDTYSLEEWLKHGNMDAPAIIYASTMGVRRLLMSDLYHSGYGPIGMYCNLSSFEFRRYSQKLPENSLLNHDFGILPWKEFVRRYKTIDLMATFVRPNTGVKIFPGRVLKCFDEASKFGYDYQIQDEALVVYADVKRITAEFRFLVVNKELIAGTMYMFQGNVDIQKNGFNTTTWLFAESVAESMDMPDEIYTMDVGIHEGKPKVVELNSFSCASLYGMDLNKVVTAVTDHTIHLWKEMYDEEYYEKTQRNRNLCTGL